MSDDTPAWPVTLDHYVERDSFRVRPVSPVVRTEVDQGPARQRRRFRSAPTMLDVSFVMSEADKETFRYWWEEFLGHGAAWFWMPIYANGGYTPHLARWVAQQDNPFIRPHGQMWAVGGVIEVRRLTLMDPDLGTIAVLYGNDLFFELASLLHGAVHEDLPAIGPITGYAP